MEYSQEQELRLQASEQAKKKRNAFLRPFTKIRFDYGAYRSKEYNNAGQYSMERKKSTHRFSTRPKHKIVSSGKLQEN